ncbi:MAG: hypothetical protein AAGC83_02310 [Pseudomonadota bacterium]
MSTAFSIGFAPLLPPILLLALTVMALVIAGYGLYRRAAGGFLRVAAILLIAATLANPSLVREQLQGIEDVAIIVVDRSPSQTMADRHETTDAVLDDLTDRLAQIDGLEVRIVEVEQQSEDRTALYAALEAAQSEVTADRIAASFLVTDGQIHDMPEAFSEALASRGPVHSLLTGSEGEIERRISIVESPAFGLVGDEISITVRVDDLPGGQDGTGAQVPLTIGLPDGGRQQTSLQAGTERTFTFTIERGGPSVFEFGAAELAGEVSTVNNRAAVTVNGVRDRLRVLLVSGEPHPGERTWRNILKSDPSVDLVHFTILRPPEKQDGTPISELSLIAFPIRELFELRLAEFDLIIFDRYRRRGVLPGLYLANIANFVMEGGAFLEASGPPFSTPLSIYRTALGEVLPAEPTGSIIEESFLPSLTEIGHRHPVTADLVAGAQRDASPAWGRWLRQIDVAPTRGNVVMAGHSERPLLILDRVGEGRVAQLASDHIWLWARGYEGGGPQGELLRRLAHWLMREPELEENDLRNSVAGSVVEIERRSLDGSTPSLTVTYPSGAEETIELSEGPDGRITARFETNELGVHRISDGERSTLALVGDLNSLELSDLRADDTALTAVADHTGGGIAWALENEAAAARGLPRLREVLPARDTVGDGWFGLRRNQTKTVVGVSDTPLLPALLAVLIGLAGLMVAWRREGR